MAGITREALDVVTAENQRLAAENERLRKAVAASGPAPLGRHGDLHRGYDRNRPPRPDTLSVGPAKPAAQAQDIEGALALALAEQAQ